MVQLKKLVLITFIIFTIIYLSFHKDYFIATLSHIQTNNYETVLYFSLIYLVANLLFIPIGMPLNLFAGMLWGVLWGGMLINILVVIVATLAFYFARTIGKNMFLSFFDKNSFLVTLRELLSHDSWLFIFAARVNPLVPFCLSNYLFGLIPDLSFRRYMSATVIANLLPCFAFSAVGAVFKSYTLENNDVRSLITKIVILLFLFSTLIFIKWFIKKIPYLRTGTRLSHESKQV